MKITENVYEKIVAASRRYSRLKSAFERFYAGGQYLSEQQSRLESFVFQPSFESNKFEILFLGMRIQFLFVPLFDGNNALQGNVICSKHHHVHSDKLIQIGSFKFDGQGMTDFEVDEGQDKLEIEFKAIDIMLHFVNEALITPLQ
jgi:hypothetical protein